jgi:hypothetical protein
MDSCFEPSPSSGIRRRRSALSHTDNGSHRLGANDLDLIMLPNSAQVIDEGFYARAPTRARIRNSVMEFGLGSATRCRYRFCTQSTYMLAKMSGLSRS